MELQQFSSKKVQMNFEKILALGGKEYEHKFPCLFLFLCVFVKSFHHSNHSQMLHISATLLFLAALQLNCQQKPSGLNYFSAQREKKKMTNIKRNVSVCVQDCEYT